MGRAVAKPIIVGTRVAANYVVVRELGSGGFGTLFVAENRLLDGQLAVVKVLKGGKQGASAEEARVLATVEHPNVVHVYAHDPEYDSIVMQYLSGVTLHSLVGWLNPVTAVRAAQSVALALDAVHQKQLVHRDVKPENILVEVRGSELGWVKLIDFGLALKIGKLNELAGTPDYCPPEQFNPLSKALPSNDIYALGVMLFELCATVRPFVSESSEELGQMHLNSPVADLLTTRKAATNPSHKDSGVVVTAEVLEPKVELLLDRVNDLLHEMLAKQPELRPDAKAVARRLDEIERDFSSESTQVGFRLPTGPLPTQAASRPKTSTVQLPRFEQKPAAESKPVLVVSHTRQRVMAGVAVVVLLLLLGWFLFGFRPDEIAVPQPVTLVAVSVDAGVQAAVIPVEEEEKPVEEELIPLPEIARQTPPSIPKKTVSEPKPAAMGFSIAKIDCTADKSWKDRKKMDLKDIESKAARVSGVKYNLFLTIERELSTDIQIANTSSECVAVENSIKKLQQDFDE